MALRYYSVVAAFVLLALSTAISSRANAHTIIDNTEWNSSDCHFNNITFFSATGANLNWDGDEYGMGWDEPFIVTEDKHVVTIKPIDSSETDSFTGTYTLASDGTSGTLVGDHSWDDHSGHHERRCSYTLKKR